MKNHCPFENPKGETKSSQLTALSSLIDKSLIAIVSFGALALLTVIWMHLTASAHLAVVQSLQALASVGTIASIAWTMVRGNSNPAVQPVIVSTKTFKCLVLLLACGMLIGSLNPQVSEMATLLGSIPATLVCTQQTGVSTDPIAEHEEGLTSEEYLITHMSK